MSESEICLNEDQLLSLLEELQTENEQLRAKSEEQGQTIHDLSSSVLRLQDELQKVSEYNVLLQRADLVLKQNEELVKKNREIATQSEKAVREAKAQAMITVTTAKKTLSDRLAAIEAKERQLEKIQKRTDEDRKAAAYAKIAEDFLISRKAEEMIDKQYQRNSEDHKRREAELEQHYRAKIAGNSLLLLSLMLYSVFVTLLTAVTSPVFMRDFHSFFGGLWGVICIIAEELLVIPELIGKIGGLIPVPILSTILYWVLFLTVAVVLYVLLALLSLLGVLKVAQVYKNAIWGDISRLILIVSMAIIVFLDDFIRSILPINLIILFFIVQAAYAAIKLWWENNT